MRELDVSMITRAVRDACIAVNYGLSPDMTAALARAAETETGETAKSILADIRENLRIAEEDRVPICQDTGLCVVFLSVGQDVHLSGGALRDAVNAGVKQGYEEGYLRKSAVHDPLLRENTKDNTPAILHVEIVPGDRVTMTLTAKGFGSENCSRIFMLKPADGRDGVKRAVLTAVREAGPNACPPMVVGVGIGGDFEWCARMAKHALTREIGTPAEDPRTAELEKELLEEVNALGIGPGGLGGKTTALAVQIETYPTHIAGLPVAVNVCCHVNRHVTVTL